MLGSPQTKVGFQRSSVPPRNACLCIPVTLSPSLRETHERHGLNAKTAMDLNKAVAGPLLNCTVVLETFQVNSLGCPMSVSCTPSWPPGTASDLHIGGSLFPSDSKANCEFMLYSHVSLPCVLPVTEIPPLHVYPQRSSISLGKINLIASHTELMQVSTR